MALFGCMNTGATGLSVTSSAMSVIGDNIANMNTTGFKGARADFASLIPNAVGVLNGAAQMGTGTSLAQIRSYFGQGTMQATGSALDLAISGNGFFQVRDGDQSFYTRDGGFFLDQAGNVVNAHNLPLQGYNALSDGTVVPRVGDLRIDTTPISSQATSEIVFDTTIASLDPTEYANTLGALTLDGNTETLSDVIDGNENIWTTTSNIYDDAGNVHEVIFLFEQNDDATITYKAVVDGADMGQTEDSLYELGEGTITLTDGKITTNTWAVTANDAFPYTTNQPDFDVLLGADATGAETEGGLIVSGAESSVNSISQDGYGVGEATGIEIAQDGMITATYSNGEEIVVGQVVLASFDAQDGLRRLGGNLWQASPNSGDPAVGVPGTGNRGDLRGYALEGSNVELEDQFVKMIQNQRTYQANSRVISTASDTLQELMNII